MFPGEILLMWIERVLSFDIDPDNVELYRHRCEKIVIGNIPPYACILDKNYNLVTRTLTCCIPQKYRDFVYPSKEEKQAALMYHVYYSIH